MLRGRKEGKDGSSDSHEGYMSLRAGFFYRRRAKMAVPLRTKETPAVVSYSQHKNPQLCCIIRPMTAVGIDLAL